MTEEEACMAVLRGIHPDNVFDAPYLLHGVDLGKGEVDWCKVADDRGWHAFSRLLHLWFVHERRTEAKPPRFPAGLPIARPEAVTIVPDGGTVITMGSACKCGCSTAWSHRSRFICTDCGRSR